MTDTRSPVTARAARPDGGRPGGAAIATLVAGLAVLLALGGCGSTAQGSGQPAGGAPSSAAPAPSAANATTPSSAAPQGVAQVFPSSTGPGCRPAGSQDQLTTSRGSAPVEATVCDYSRVAPGALVIFARWPDVAAAQSYYDDTANLGPRIENFDVWQSNGVQQGPLYTAQSEGRVISTGLYTGLAYSWEIRTSTLEESNAVFGQVRFRPRSELGG
jgi:serine/threonine-protein kinase